MLPHHPSSSPSRPALRLSSYISSLSEDEQLKLAIQMSQQEHEEGIARQRQKERERRRREREERKEEGILADSMMPVAYTSDAVIQAGSTDGMVAGIAATPSRSLTTAGAASMNMPPSTSVAPLPSTCSVQPSLQLAHQSIVAGSESFPSTHGLHLIACCCLTQREDDPRTMGRMGKCMSLTFHVIDRDGKVVMSGQLRWTALVCQSASLLRAYQRHRHVCIQQSNNHGRLLIVLSTPSDVIAAGLRQHELRVLNDAHDQSSSPPFSISTGHGGQGSNTLIHFFYSTMGSCVRLLDLQRPVSLPTLITPVRAVQGQPTVGFAPSFPNNMRGSDAPIRWPPVKKEPETQTIIMEVDSEGSDQNESTTPNADNDPSRHSPSIPPPTSSSSSQIESDARVAREIHRSLMRRTCIKLQSIDESFVDDDLQLLVFPLRDASNRLRNRKEERMRAYTSSGGVVEIARTTQCVDDMMTLLKASFRDFTNDTPRGHAAVLLMDRTKSKRNNNRADSTYQAAYTTLVAACIFDVGYADVDTHKCQRFRITYLAVPHQHSGRGFPTLLVSHIKYIAATMAQSASMTSLLCAPSLKDKVAFWCNPSNGFVADHRLAALLSADNFSDTILCSRYASSVAQAQRDRARALEKVRMKMKLPEHELKPYPRYKEKEEETEQERSSNKKATSRRQAQTERQTNRRPTGPLSTPTRSSLAPPLPPPPTSPSFPRCVFLASTLLPSQPPRPLTHASLAAFWPLVSWVLQHHRSVVLPGHPPAVRPLTMERIRHMEKQTVVAAVEDINEGESVLAPPYFRLERCETLPSISTDDFLIPVSLIDRCRPMDGSLLCVIVPTYFIYVAPHSTQPMQMQVMPANN